jgi:hypothetical protein
MTIAQITQVAYEMYAHLQSMSTGMGMVSWEGLKEEDKETMCYVMGEYLKYPRMSARDFHDRWMKTMINDGWKYGKEWDEERKETPRLVPYIKLPQLDIMREEVFSRTSRSLLAHLTEQLVYAPNPRDN